MIKQSDFPFALFEDQALTGERGKRDRDGQENTPRPDSESFGKGVGKRDLEEPKHTEVDPRRSRYRPRH